MNGTAQRIGRQAAQRAVGMHVKLVTDDHQIAGGEVRHYPIALAIQA